MLKLVGKEIFTIIRTKILFIKTCEYGSITKSTLVYIMNAGVLKSATFSLTMSLFNQKMMQK